MKHLGWLLLLLPLVARGQVVGPPSPVGPITPGHCVNWVNAGYIGDAGAACGGGGGGVAQIVAGTNVTISPTNGLGTVTINAAGGGGSPANPTATVGPTAVNGVATTYMRSDAAPALSTTAVTPGSYTSANITVDANGRLTAAANGTASATSVTPGTTTVVGATAPCLLDNSAGTTLGCAAIGQGLALNSGTIGTTVPNRTSTSSFTVLSTDMGGQVNSNVTGGGTITIPAISSTVFAAGMSLTLVNYSASTAAISTTPVVNAGGGCVSGTGIPAGATWYLLSNGTTLDCNQSVSAGGGGGTSTIASGTSALGTSAIASGTCATAVTTAAAGVATTDSITWSFNADPTSTTGYSPTVNGMLTIISYPTSGNVNWKVCNNTTASITPGAITLNWRVVR